MMARFWVADLHLGHAKVAAMRGFDSVEEHDRHLTRQLANAGRGSEVWVLGDISSGRAEGESDALSALQSITLHEGVIFHLIAGNHDSVSSIHRNGYKKQAEWMLTFDSIQQFGRIRLNKTDVLMSHYPYARSGDGPGRGPERYTEYRLPDTGFPLIHGHTHQPAPHMRLYGDWEDVLLMETGGDPALDEQQFCVSWDAHRRLVTEHDLNQWIERIKA